MTDSERDLTLKPTSPAFGAASVAATPKPEHRFIAAPTTGQPLSGSFAPRASVSSPGALQ